jgi:adenosine deaminase
MPKGGDLHHHFSGSIYTEYYVDQIEKRDYWIELSTLDVAPSPPADASGWTRIRWLMERGEWAVLRERLLRKWSAKEFLPGEISSAEDFFSSFLYITPIQEVMIREGLLELKKRALDQNLCYLETQFASPSWRDPFPTEPGQDDRIREWKEAEVLQDSLEGLYVALISRPDFLASRDDYVDTLEAIHRELVLDEDRFLIRYQNFALRTIPPSAVFRNLLLAFATAASSELIVGVNFVAPEHHPVALRDYALHMKFFSFLRKKFPGVRVALHAGELRLGQVPPEDLNGHIREAIQVVSPERIGHGISISHESEAFATLDRMREDEIAVEINLKSNAFILGVSGDEHPIRIYRDAGVPIVISTDDEGVLRTDMTEQFVLLAYQYRDISYAEIREMVLNSIRFSFLDGREKSRLLRLTRVRLDAFERQIAERFGE